jgi:hypothetical protein
MKTGGHPTDVSGTGDGRVNSIIGGQAGRVAGDLLKMPDNTTRINAKITILEPK